MADQPKKKVLLTTKRVEEIADSLDKESIKKRAIGNTNKKIAEAFIKKGKGDEALFGSREFSGSGAITANERLEKSKEQLESADKDKENASRYRKQIQEQEMMKNRIRQNKSNDKSSVIKLMRKIIG